MNEPPCNFAALEDELRSTFLGVVLGDGVSIRQSQVMAQFGEGCTDDEFAALPRSEEKMNWSAVPVAELDEACVAFFDPEAFRFYIPALLLNLAKRYEFMSFGMISTLGCLCPEPHRSYGSAEALQWALLSRSQRRTVARFLSCLPSLVALEQEDRVRVEISLSRYWNDHLVSTAR